MSLAMLQPVAALAAWTMVMWLWMYATRMPAMSRVPGLEPARMVGGAASALDAVLPPKVQWVAHNYNHLHEQPTVFYAVALTHAMLGSEGMMVTLAWGYVALRVVHSVFQALVNRVIVRFLLFVLASLCLFGLVIGALLALF